jgi:alkyldihydroxyacetonephosphate synthase
VDALDALIAQLPSGTVSTHPGELAAHARDQWALAKLREARGDRVTPPAALVFPRSTDHVATTLAWAQETGTPVVPRGAASGLAGGAEALQRSVVIDLSLMEAILGIDAVSQTVETQAGIRGSALEAALEPRGMTVGHYPESLEVSTVGGWVAAASAGYASAGYGSIEDVLVGLTAVLPGGSVLRLKPIPRSAAGPDLRRLYVGSEGTLGVITEVTLVTSRLPAGRLWESFRPHSFESGAAFVREIVQRGHRPLVVRLLDEAEASALFSAFGQAGPALIVGFDAGAPAAEAQAFELQQLAKELGARSLGPELAEHWWGHRHDPVAWYEGAMGPERTFGPGVVVDAVDVAGLWRLLPHLYADVRGALLGHAEVVRCSLGHPEVTGASLHFSFLARAADDREAERVYRETWDDAMHACLSAGGTITHHHGVGLLKVPHMAAEAGGSGIDALRRIKAALDPSGVMNPGKLVPPVPPSTGPGPPYDGPT